MGFKLPGKSIHNGTNAHRSALKMHAHVSPSPAKSHVAGHGTYKGALEANPELEKLIAARNKEKYVDGDKSKGRRSDFDESTNTAYADAQNAINKAYYGPDFEDKYKGTPKEEKEEVVVPEVEQSIISKKGDEKKSKIQTKADTKKSEVDENVTKGEAKSERKSARKEFGRGSKEHLEAKAKHLEAKEADRQGEQGGKKQGIFRRISSNINQRRQANIEEKLTGESDQTKKLIGGGSKRKLKRAKLETNRDIFPEGTTYSIKNVYKRDKEGTTRKRKWKAKYDVDNDGKVDFITRSRTKYDKEGTKTKNVKREGGRRTVYKYDDEGKYIEGSKKSRRTLGGILTGKGKLTKEEKQEKKRTKLEEKYKKRAAKGKSTKRVEKRYTKKGGDVEEMKKKIYN